MAAKIQLEEANIEYWLIFTQLMYYIKSINELDSRWKHFNFEDSISFFLRLMKNIVSRLFWHWYSIRFQMWRTVSTLLTLLSQYNNSHSYNIENDILSDNDDDNSTGSAWLVIVLQGILILLACVANLALSATKIAIQRDWIIVITSKFIHDFRSFVPSFNY